MCPPRHKMRHGAARFAKKTFCRKPARCRSRFAAHRKSVVDPRAVAEGWGFGPGALDLTAHGVRDTPAVRFSEIARASSRRAHAPARPAPRPGPAYCSALPSADGGCAFGSRSKPRYVTTLLRQVATAFCAIPCIRHGAPLLLGAPPPPRPSFHEGLAMGQYEGSGLHSDDCISCKAQ